MIEWLASRQWSEIAKESTGYSVSEIFPWLLNRWIVLTEISL